MKRLLLILKICLLLTAASFIVLNFSACHHSSDSPEEPVKRTVLVYMIADNNLGTGGWEEADLREMSIAMSGGATSEGGDLLVYRNSPGTAPDQLVRMLSDGSQEVLVTYDDDGLCSVDIDRMDRVMADIRRYAPATSYGLVFWSHGTGWISEATSRSEIAPLSFGSDRSRRMKITSLASVLNNYPSDWIYFDCCHMGTVEIIYELRHAARQIVASTTELPLEGMPYDVNIPEFFKPEPSMTLVANNTFSYYRDNPAATDNSCSIAVYNTEEMEAFARATAAILHSGVTLPADYRPTDYGRGSLSGYIFDMRDYIMALDPSPTLRATWEESYARLIEYQAATPRCYGIDMNKFTGIGCYIVNSSSDICKGYDEYEWSRLMIE